MYQREMLGLSYQQIASNLCVDVFTVWRTVKRFQVQGTVAPTKNVAHYKLSDFEMFAILEIVLENPSIYLKEICKHISDNFGTVIAESTVCRFLQHNNFSHKKLSNIARQRNLGLRSYFMEECKSYTPEMMVFVDETGCDRRSSMRKFGYALKGRSNQCR